MFSVFYYTGKAVFCQLFSYPSKSLVITKDVYE